MARRLGRLNKITAQKFGNWAGVMNFLKDSGTNVNKEANFAITILARKVKSKIIYHLLAQDLNWVGLSEVTKRNKKNNKDLILRDTDKYLDNIKLWKENGITMVGVKKGVSYKRKGSVISLDRLAVYLEYGTTKMPARPLWAPTFEEVGGKSGIKKLILDSVYKRLTYLAKDTPVIISKNDLLKMTK